mmetsp:Transcript_8751/g.19873  ORF Transcript_8751/g.19873 Transcript_8751/m.19873 type:complete len:210 (-) Transcript_8751:219-848(-)
MEWSLLRPTVGRPFPPFTWGLFSCDYRLRPGSTVRDFLRFQVFRVNVGQVMACEAASLEIYDVRVQLASRLQQVINCLKDDAIGTEALAQLLLGEVRHHKFPLAGHVDAIHVRVLHRRRGGGEVHALGTRLAHHVDNLAHRRSAYDRVVDEKHILALEDCAHRIQLAAHGARARLLVWHDERAPDVPILHEAFTIRQAELGGNLDARGS